MEGILLSCYSASAMQCQCTVSVVTLSRYTCHVLSHFWRVSLLYLWSPCALLFILMYVTFLILILSSSMWSPFYKYLCSHLVINVHDPSTNVVKFVCSYWLYYLGHNLLLGLGELTENGQIMFWEDVDSWGRWSVVWLPVMVHWLRPRTDWLRVTISMCSVCSVLMVTGDQEMGWRPVFHNIHGQQSFDNKQAGIFNCTLYSSTFNDKIKMAYLVPFIWHQKNHLPIKLKLSTFKHGLIVFMPIIPG